VPDEQAHVVVRHLVVWCCLSDPTSNYIAKFVKVVCSAHDLLASLNDYARHPFYVAQFSMVDSIGVDITIIGSLFFKKACSQYLLGVIAAWHVRQHDQNGKHCIVVSPIYHLSA
jgi:hypothetical protein